MIKPLPGYVLISPIEEEQMSGGGIALPETSKDKPMKGRVVSVSPVIPLPQMRDSIHFEYGESKTSRLGTWRNQLEMVKVGATVIYKKWTNQEVDHKGKKYLLVHFNELLGVIE